MNIFFAHKFGGVCMTVLLMVQLTGCSSTDTGMVQSLSADSEPAPPVAASRPPVDPGPSPEELAAQRKREQMLAVTRFYFDLDKSDLKPAALEPLRYHARQLHENPAMRVRLEGYADERGTREYNKALGMRRANAVKQFLQEEGASARQLEVVSYGEDRPAVTGTGEEVWSKNRRVELKTLTEPDIGVAAVQVPR